MPSGVSRSSGRTRIIRHGNQVRERIGLITWHFAVQQTPPEVVDVTYDDSCFTPIPSRWVGPENR